MKNPENGMGHLSRICSTPRRFNAAVAATSRPLVLRRECAKRFRKGITMKFSEATVHRIFVVRLEDGDSMPGCIESFCNQHDVQRALCFLIGGVDRDGRLVVGPTDATESPVRPMTLALNGVHEIAGIGTIFPDESGAPRLHMHAAVERGESAHVGCIRLGVSTWKVGEVVLLELAGSDAHRQMDAAAGFLMLHP